MNTLMKRSAIFSSDRKYRYVLWRIWDEEKPACVFIGLNPSTADENIDDPTIKKCIKFSMRWGLGALCMLNLFAWRATDPREMIKCDKPRGEDNDAIILKATARCPLVVAAWGVKGGHQDRDVEVLTLLREQKIVCLDVTDGMFPKHPLYCRDDSVLKGYRKNEIYLL